MKTMGEEKQCESKVSLLGTHRGSQPRSQGLLLFPPYEARSRFVWREEEETLGSKLRGSLKSATVASKPQVTEKRGVQSTSSSALCCVRCRSVIERSTDKSKERKMYFAQDSASKLH